MYYKRHIEKTVKTSLLDTPVVIINGARQTGKSTFVESLVSTGVLSGYVTMDDPLQLVRLQQSPLDTLRSYPIGTVIDEVQKIPELFPVIKKVVDEDRVPGRFVLTGSANVMLLPTISESLAGRIAIHTMNPLSVGERIGSLETFIDSVFYGSINPSLGKKTKSEIASYIYQTGFPEAYQRKENTRKIEWFRNYVSTLIQRDVKELANIEQAPLLARILQILAIQNGGILSFANIARDIEIPQTTLKRYLGLLQALYTTYHLPSWNKNISKRLIKSPKVYIPDNGLLQYLIGYDWDKIKQDPRYIGMFTENFIVQEIRKQIEWSEIKPAMYYFRTTQRQEVDIILENRSQEIVAIEIKSSSQLSNNDYNGIRLLKQEIGSNFLRGIILYSGFDTIEIEKDIWVMPINSLWKM